MQAAPAMQAPRRITLMLPLEGRIAPAGAAVRDGFMAAYFALPASARAALQISVLDTTAFANARAAYAEALARGSDLVVGPLTKQGVDELLTADNLSVPVLALNRTSDERAGPDGSLQFGLAPEDEVTQVAQRALAAGHRRALLLRPAGDWGNKLELALRAVWESGGGHIVARADYAERSSHSESIKTALGLYQSEQRSREVRRLLGESMESASRRRRDLDVVFMLAPTTADAKSLAPLLAYHYAGDLPRYAISTANSAELREGDRDLEGLHIVEMPWLLSQGSLRRTLQGAALEPGASFSRLHALGVDALALARLPTLPDEWTLHAGVTGFLRANQKRQLDRELKLVEFVRDGLRGE